MNVTLKKYWDLARHYHVLLFFVGGFLFDVLTLEELDDSFTLISQMLYLFVALGLFLIHSEEKTLSSFLPKKKWIQKIGEWEEDIFHFALGALLNAFILYFFKSSTFFNSMILLIFLSALLLLNEFRPSFLKHDLIPSILAHTCMISFFVILSPIVFGKMGTLTFLFGVVVYLGLIFFWIYKRKNWLRKRRQILISSFLAIFFLTMYITRVFPPVPLSLKKIGVYHKVEKVMNKGETRYLAFSSSPWWAFWNQTSTPFEARPTDAIHVFTRVFAPGGFSDTVYIEWWWRGEKEWMKTDRIPLEITGGRREGFRGFTYKNNYAPGEWMVLVTTSDGLEIGRTHFELKEVPEDFEISLNSQMY